MNKQILSFILQLVAFATVILGIHYYIFSTFFQEIVLYFPLWTIYAFNALLVIIMYNIIRYKVVKEGKNAYTLFITLTMVKMALAIVFLLPLFGGKAAHPQAEVFNFFIPYFLFLAFEIYALNNFLQKR